MDIELRKAAFLERVASLHGGTGLPLRVRVQRLAKRRLLRQLRRAGNAARDQRNWAGVINFYGKVVELDPSATDLAIQVGHALKEMGDHDSAHTTYQALLQLRPDDDDLHLQIAHLAKVMGRLDLARTHYGRAFEINADNADARREHDALAGVSSLPRSPTAGDVRVAGDGGAGDNPGTLRSVGDLARDAKMWGAAYKAYGDYLRQVPDDVQIWAQYGNCLKEGGRLAEAETAYRKGLAVKPDDPDLYLQLGHCLKLRGHQPAAIAAYRRSLELSPLRSTYHELHGLGADLDLGAAVPLPARRGGVLYLEFTDLFHVLGTQPGLSGIQRVQLGILASILGPHGRLTVSPVQCVIWHDKQLWTLREDLLRMVLLNQQNPGDKAFERQQRLVAELEAGSSFVRLDAQDTFVSTGVVYMQPGLAVPRARMRRAGVRIGAMIYDFIPLTDPEYLPPILTSEFSAAIAELLLQVDFVVTGSEFVAGETRRLMRESGYRPVPVKVVLNALELPVGTAGRGPGDNPWTPAIADLRETEFVLCVGTFAPHKNHLLLLNVWRLLAREGGDVPRLVLVGRRGMGGDELFRQLDATNNLDGTVVVVEGPTDDELSTLYEHCLFTMFPSFVEGWGLPVGESLSRGKLCLASGTTSIPEVGGDLALYIDPHNASGAAQLVRRLLTDRAELATREARIRREFKPRSFLEFSRELLGTMTTMAGQVSRTPEDAMRAPGLGPDRMLRLHAPRMPRRIGTALPLASLLAEALLPRLVPQDGWGVADGQALWMARPMARLGLPVAAAVGTRVGVVMQLRVAAGPGAPVVMAEAACGARATAAAAFDGRRTVLLQLVCTVGAESYVDLTLSVAQTPGAPDPGPPGIGLCALFYTLTEPQAVTHRALEMVRPASLPGPSGATVEPRGRAAMLAALACHQVLADGWAEAEAWGSWLAGTAGVLSFRVADQGVGVVRVILRLRTTPSAVGLQIGARSACGAHTARPVPEGQDTTLLLRLDVQPAENGQVTLTLEATGQPIAGAYAPYIGLSGIIHGPQASPGDRMALSEAVLFEDSTRASVDLPGLAATLRFNVTGHVNGSYSLAMVNRAMALALDRAEPGSVRLHQVEGEPKHDLSRVPGGERPAIAALAARPPHAAATEVTIVQHWPFLVPSDPGDLPLAYPFWEESQLPREMVQRLNGHFAGVLAPSRIVARMLVDSGVRLPVRVIGFAPRLEAFAAIGAARLAAGPRPKANETRRLTFLHVSSCFPRKGADVLLEAFAKAFDATDPVQLVIKTFPNPHNDMPQQIERLRLATPELAPITLINRDLGTEALERLYAEADAMVLPSRGEGFNIPAAEAMAAGLSLIVTGAGAHMDFVDADFARLLDYRFAPSGTHLRTADSVWFEPDVDDLVAALQECLAAHRSQDEKAVARLRRGHTAAAAVADGLAWAGRIRASALDLLLAPEPQSPLIAWVTTWNVRCGIAEYSRMLLGGWPNSGRAVTVLRDERLPESDVAGVDQPSSRSAWRRDAETGLDALPSEIAATNAQVVVIQHQPGLISWPHLARLLRDSRLSGRCVVVMLHNVQSMPPAGDAAHLPLLAALGGVARILVHTADDLNRLKAHGLIGNVALFPHGALRLDRPVPVPHALPPGSAPLIGSYGFLLPHKGFKVLIEAFSQLRRTWPAARLRMVTSLYPIPLSVQTEAECRDLARSLGLEGAIEWHTDFLPNDVSLRLLSECDAVILPYQDTLESSSAAVRTALASRAPVMVTPIAIFADVGSAVLRMHGTDVAAIVGGVSWLLNHQDARGDLQTQAGRWLAEHDWAVVSARLHDMLAGLQGSRA